jgi:hypothetical protein
MKKLNFNQRKVISEILVNLSTVLISVLVVSKIFIEKKFDYFSIISSFIGLFVSFVMFYGALLVVK